MDTLRDRQVLEEMVERGEMPLARAVDARAGAVSEAVAPCVPGSRGHHAELALSHAAVSASICQSPPVERRAFIVKRLPRASQRRSGTLKSIDVPKP